MSDNIFTQTAEWNRQRAERAKQQANERAAESTNREVNRITAMRNGKTGADEALIIIKIALGLVTIFTAYCGWLYYNDTFSKTFHPAMGFAFACGMAILVEVAKVYLMHLSLRSIFFGWMFKDWWSTGAWAVVLVFAIGAFYWSVDVSTDGMNRLTEQSADERTERADLNAMIAAATADIDKQLADLQGNQNEAMKKKNKLGRTTNTALRTAEQTGKSIASLNEQRAVIVKQVTEDYQKGSQKREVKITGWAAWVKKFGGYMEAAAGICLLAWAFFERRLYSENMALLIEKDEKEQHRQDQMAGF